MSKFDNNFSVIGLGFVGAAMLVAINSLNQKKNFKIVGVEQNTPKGRNILSKLKKGKFPFKVNDRMLIKNAKKLRNRNFFLGTSNIKEIYHSKVVICSINFDIKKIGKKIFSNEKKFLQSIYNIAENLNPKSVLIIESTLPPDRPLDIRESPEFITIAQRVREGLRAGHSYD